MPIKEIAKVFCHNRRVSADFQRELQSFGFSWGSLIDEMPWGTDNKYLILIYSYEGKRIIMRMTEADWNECNAVAIHAADELGNNMIKLKLLLATIKPNIDTPADKIIPSVGYTKENTCVIGWRVNRIKNDATLEELEAIVAYMKKKMVTTNGQD